MVRNCAARCSVDTACGALLRELEQLWTEIGESEEEKDSMLCELERECMQVYRRKVDEASKSRAQLHQSLLAKEAELAALIASLGEHGFRPPAEKRTSLKDQLASMTPLLEDLRLKKQERIQQFTSILSQIEKINSELTAENYQDNSSNGPIVEEHDLSVRKFNECQARLQSLQKEKSERLQKILGYIDEVHSLCRVLGLDFQKTVIEVHPSLCETDSDKSTNISNSTLDGLSQTIIKLRREKQCRIQKLRETVDSLFKLWNLMNPSEEERRSFEKITCIVQLPEQEVTLPGLLAEETIKRVDDEVELLTKLKASRMKELVLKRRSELEETCRNAHIEPDTSTAPDKLSAMIDSGLVDPSELLASIDSQIVKANEEAFSRKEIMDRVNKWLAACEEENWLEEYNQDDNRYNAGRGVHLNLKRAEKARVTVSKTPAIVDSLTSKTLAWEDERNKHFLYDGVRLVKVLEEYKLTRQQKEEEKKRLRDQKKLQGSLLTEKEALYGSKPSPKRSNSFNRKANGYYTNVSTNGSMTPIPRRVSAGSATPELLTPRSYSGRYNGYFQETRRLSTAPLNFVAIPKEDTISFTSVSGSEPGSPPHP